MLRHAFVGVGWGSYRGESSLEPLLVTISNALDTVGEWADQPTVEFQFRLNQWGAVQSDFAMGATGQTISGAEKKTIWRHMRRIVKKGAPRRAMLRGLIDCSLWIASRHSSVGKSLMTLCLPKSAIIRQRDSGRVMALSGAPADDHVSFFYLPAGGNHLVQYGPHFVIGGTVATDFSILASSFTESG